MALNYVSWLISWVKLSYQFFAFLSVDAQINLNAGRTCAGLAFLIIEESQEDNIIASNEQYCG